MQIQVSLLLTHSVSSFIILFLILYEQTSLGRGIVMCCSRETVFTMAMVCSGCSLGGGGGGGPFFKWFL